MVPLRFLMLYYWSTISTEPVMLPYCFQRPHIFHSGIDKLSPDWSPKFSRGRVTPGSVLFSIMNFMSLEQETGALSPRTPQQMSQTLTTVTVNCFFRRRQVTDPASSMMQRAGGNTRSPETWVLLLILPPDGGGKTTQLCRCWVCQGMIMRNSEIMSGKPFELLRGKRLHKHKVLLLPSPHQPRMSEFGFLQKPLLSLPMKGLADPSASPPAEIPKLWRI